MEADALPDLGFELLAEKGYRLPQLTAARLPAGVDDTAARTTLRNRFGIEVGGGLGPLAGAGWRIGLMGNNAVDRTVATLLGAIRTVLRGPEDR